MDNPGQSRRITISPVTRIEGHARITLDLNEVGEVQDAHFHVNEFRGFEKFCEGRMFTEMPSISPRICGICPVSHAVSSAKACEMIMRVEVPHTGTLLRRLMHLGQQISSHALAFFHLSSPDFLLGWDSDPASRNVIGLAAANPDLAKRGIRLRKFGQELSERITGKKIHVMGILGGGAGFPLTESNRRALLDWVPEALETTRIGLELFRKYAEENGDDVHLFTNFETMYLGMVGPNGEHEFYDGKLRFVGADGGVIQDQLDPVHYLDTIAERPQSFSYLKYPYYKPMGYPDGVYRVGPLARLNVASSMTTPKAQEEFQRFKSIGNGKPIHGDFYFHYARLIEVISAVEIVEQILRDDRVTSTEIQAHAGRNQEVGIGCSEAPRGTLFHHYTTHSDGTLKKVNLLIATGQNNPSMNLSVLKVAQRLIRKGKEVTEGVLNRIEAAIRCYDPCLSCSTHAYGAMPMIVDIRNPDGDVIQQIRRD